MKSRFKMKTASLSSGSRMEVYPTSETHPSSTKRTKDSPSLFPTLFHECVENKPVNSKVGSLSLKNVEKKSFSPLNNIALAPKKNRISSKNSFNFLISTTIKKLETPTFYLYSSGGNGHKSAKEARLETDWTQLYEAVKENSFPECPELKSPEIFIQYCKSQGLLQEFDTLLDFLGSVGEKVARLWNNAQKAGDIKKQESLASKQWLSDFFFAIPLFAATLSRLIQFKPAIVVNTQAMATPSILLAIKFYNTFYKPEDSKETKMHLYMTDLPTKKAKHFLHSIQRLSSWEGRNNLILMMPRPSEKKDADLFNKLPLKDSQIIELTTDNLPVRPAFLKAVKNNLEDFDPSNVTFKITGKEEGQLLKRVLEKQNIELGFPFSDIADDGYEVDAPMQISYSLSEAKNSDDIQSYFLMLGSQPTEKTIISYVDRFIELSRSHPNKKYKLFPFTGAFVQTKKDESNDCFYRKLCDYILEKENLPRNLQIIPLSYQEPSNLVQLMSNCHTITRSGGLTTMELLVLDGLSTKKMRYIDTSFIKDRELIKRIPLWERGNFNYLANVIGKDRVQATNPTLLLA